MQSPTLSARRISYLMIAGIAVLVLGYCYVIAFSLGPRAIILVHLGALFFLGIALFVRDLKSFLLFALLFLIPLQFGYHVVHRPLTLFDPSGELIVAQPFSAGIQVDSVDVVLLLLYAYWIAGAAIKGWRNRIAVGGSLGFLLLAWILLLLLQSVMNAKNFQYSFFEIVVLFKGFLLFFYLVNNVTTMRDVRVVIYALFAGTVAQALFIWFQFITRLNYTAHATQVEYIGPEGFRAVGFTGSPDNASALMALMFPVGLSVYLLMRKRTEKVVAIICMSIVMVAVMFTLVRAAGFAILISSLMVFLLVYATGGMSLRRVGKVAAAILVILLVTSPLIIIRFEHGTMGEDRWPLMQTAWNMAKNNFLLGVGANNYPFHIDTYTPVRTRHAWAYTVHNEYLLRLAETGILGALFYYAFIVMMMIKLWRLRRSGDTWIYAIAIGLFSALVGSIFHRSLSMYFYQSLFWMTCVILALTHVMERIERSKQAQRMQTRK